MPATVAITPDQTIPPTPTLVTPAPIRPPISAWLDEDGMPNFQVMTFQTIAPDSAPKMTCASITFASMIPLPTVCAT